MLKSQKPKDVEKMKHLIGMYQSVGILNMRKLPGRQLHEIRGKLKGKAIIKMSRKSLILRTLNESGREKLSEKLTQVDVPALILSNENPFKLFKFLNENKTSAAAKSGDVVDEDIIIEEGSTGIPPGPAMAQLQAAGLKTKVESGKISLVGKKTILKAGGSVTPGLINAFNLLKIEPMKIGLTLVYVFENDIVYDSNVLDIDDEKFMADLNQCVFNGINLSLNIGYITSYNAEMAVQKAYVEAKTLCLETGFMTKEFISDIILRAAREGLVLESEVGKR
ncbi:MAG: 50S ribosomal protein L10 [Candidatus Aenigmarchaeota archaeon]|nr:50S ribosomal protein L10 [Candidatus Aenigmarchaeota archaeon]